MSAPGQAAASRSPFASREFGLRTVSALVLGAVVLSALAVGGWAFAAVWLVAGILGAGEWIAMSRPGRPRPLLLATGVALALLCVAFEAGASAPVLAGLAGLALAVVLAIAPDGESRRKAALGLVCAAVVALVPTALRDDPAIGVVGPAWMFAVVWSTDIVAYVTGRTLGGPKLLPRVSPKKTWSGALGGLAGGTLAGLAVVLVARDHGWRDLAAAPLPLVALLSAAASLVSQAGDLYESALKRRCGVKDSGRSIPGHGGVMDRLDGFFTVAVLAGLCLLARRWVAA